MAGFSFKARLATLFSTGKSPAYTMVEQEFVSDLGSHVQNLSPFQNSLAYFSFVLVGIAMLWPWNCFIAAVDFWHSKGLPNPGNWISASFTMANLVSIFLLTKFQGNLALRTSVALLFNIVLFLIIAGTTAASISASAYFGFIIFMCVLSACSTGLMQNGAFGFCGLFPTIHAQAIMTGQGIAGILPSVVQIALLATSKSKQDAHSRLEKESARIAFAYFLTASGISVLAFLGHVVLIRIARNLPQQEVKPGSPNSTSFYRLWLLFKNLLPLSLSVVVVFLVTLSTFPAITSTVTSVSSQPLRSDIFISLGFVVWNASDLLGRSIAGLTPVSKALIPHPRYISILTWSRLIFIPLFILCNIYGKGAIVKSDGFFFFLLISHGISNGLLGSTCIMSALEMSSNREDAGGFMSLMLCLGLALGSCVSFAVAAIAKCSR